MSDIPTMSQFAKREDCLLAREKWYQERIEALEAELRQQLASSEPVATVTSIFNGTFERHAEIGVLCVGDKLYTIPPDQSAEIERLKAQNEKLLASLKLALIEMMALPSSLGLEITHTIDMELLIKEVEESK